MHHNKSFYIFVYAWNNLWAYFIAACSINVHIHDTNAYCVLCNGKDQPRRPSSPPPTSLFLFCFCCFAEDMPVCLCIHINIVSEQYVICLHRKTCKLIKIFEEEQQNRKKKMMRKTTANAQNILVRQYKMDYDAFARFLFFSLMLDTVHTIFWGGEKCIFIITFEDRWARVTTKN